MSTIKIGIIGLDTSHVTHFTRIFNDVEDPFHVSGLQVTAAFPGGSPGFEASTSRVAGFSEELNSKYGVELVDSITGLPEDLDAYLLESVDGGQHLEQFSEIVSRGKPVFVDKPFATSTADAKQILELAAKNNVPVMTSSALRYAEAFVAAVGEDRSTIIGVDAHGPMALIPEMPGYFWYGVHSVEMLFAAMGKGCVSVHATRTEKHDVVTGVWADGRIGTVRGNRVGFHGFGGTVFRETGAQAYDVASGKTPFYASLMQQVGEFIKTGKSPIDSQESYEIISFMEAANRSVEQQGASIKLG